MDNKIEMMTFTTLRKIVDMLTALSDETLDEEHNHKIMAVAFRKGDEALMYFKSKEDYGSEIPDTLEDLNQMWDGGAE